MCLRMSVDVALGQTHRQPKAVLFCKTAKLQQVSAAENGMTKQKQAGHMAAKQPPKATLSRFKNREGVHISHMQSGKHKKV